MSEEWYVARGDRQVGPYSARDLKHSASVGQLRPDDQLWKDGMADWVPASQFNGLFPETTISALSESDIESPLPDEGTAIYTMKGVQDHLEVFEDHVAITPKGVLGFFNKGLKGTKEIPFSSIIAVQFKEAGALFSGYLQFTIPGGNESKGGLFAAVHDENTFMFKDPKNNALVREIKEHIDAKIRKLRTPQTTVPTSNLSDELQKLANLKQQGVLSEEEFRAAKKKLIG